MAIRYLFGKKGPSGYGSATTALQVATDFKARIEGRVFMVTGATDGIGREAALALAANGAHIVMVGRSPEKMSRVAAELKELPTNPQVTEVLCDLGDQKSIRKAAADFLALDLPLHVLINNAGCMFPGGYATTVDGIERQFGVNVVGPYLLTKLLLPKLEATGEDTRIVNLSSSAQHMSYKDGIRIQALRDGTTEKGHSGSKAYGESKLSNLIHAQLLNERTKVTAVSLHPGVIMTSLFDYFSKGMVKATAVIGRAFLKTVPQGAATTVYCATAPDVVGGHFYQDCNDANTTINKHAKNPELASQLWDLCEDLCKRSEEDSE